LWQAGQNPVITGTDFPGYFQPLGAGKENWLIGLRAASATLHLGGGTGGVPKSGARVAWRPPD